MADEQPATEREDGARQGGGLIWKIGITGGVVLACAIAALLVFTLVLKPMFEEEPTEPVDVTDMIPPTAVTFPFEESYASVVMSDPDMPSSTLLYKVAIECANEETRVLVEKNQSRFLDMLGDLHRNRTREELNDPLVLDSIKKQALQKCNEIIRRLQQQADSNIRVTDVFYEKFYIQDI